jgi:hypothetical protein
VRPRTGRFSRLGSSARAARHLGEKGLRDWLTTACTRRYRRGGPPWGFPAKGTKTRTVYGAAARRSASC